MQDGTMAEIRCFAGNYAPKYWALCAGQTMNLSTNQALFALLGTVYGGNGSTNFKLPDLRGRIPVGTGTSQSLGLTFTLGQIGGEENHTLITSEMPQHTHAVAVTQGTGSPAVSITLNGSSSSGNTTNPANALSATDDSSGNIVFFAPSGSTKVAMAPNSVTVSNLVSGVPGVTIGTAGATQAHSNLQPLAVLNYIICVQGVFPSRN
ncbi:microcystin-dependent protein [Filimonas zeae]|uniref:Tail Collar domain-containing protein n=1 Tax=Filimonas zeae TaxID=1737353 RepID=A0A917MWV1_9BACT|nr:tail fiber protein [Filimonas zeae]MDR6340303.1 microcystin-dependent protein [Filimonas zeae]GGH72095.1 tail Collar domain-containing protein [Filimonas zeae]